MKGPRLGQGVLDSVADQVGMLYIDDIDGKRQYPTYTCAHCNVVVIMRPNRARPRTTCLKCMRWICESTKECSTICTPVDELANDMFEAAPKWQPFRPWNAPNNEIISNGGIILNGAL